MNRVLFITIGAVTIIIVFLVWLFLFINGAPSNTREIFSDLGVIDSVERPTEPDLTEVEAAGGNGIVLNLTDGGLQQVTTNPVAGFAVASTSGNTVLRFVERGTGYIFEINLTSGLQTQVTPSTIPNAVEAYFAPDLNSVVIVSERQGRLVTLLALPNNPDTQASHTILDNTAENIQFIDENTLTYTRNSFTDTVGYIYDLTDQTVTERFRLKVPDATVLTTENGNIFAYAKPTALFKGALYEVVDGSLLPASQAALGLVPFIGGGLGIVNQVEDGEYLSYRLPNYTEQSVIMLPEKCAAGEAGRVLCGAPEAFYTANFVENWYKGITNSDDWLWDIDTTTGQATVLAIPTQTTGRQIDVLNPVTDPAQEKLVFINKIDATLWLLQIK